MNTRENFWNVYCLVTNQMCDETVNGSHETAAWISHDLIMKQWASFFFHIPWQIINFTVFQIHWNCSFPISAYQYVQGKNKYEQYFTEKKCWIGQASSQRRKILLSSQFFIQCLQHIVNYMGNHFWDLALFMFEYFKNSCKPLAKNIWYCKMILKFHELISLVCRFYTRWKYQIFILFYFWKPLSKQRVTSQLNNVPVWVDEIHLWSTLCCLHKQRENQRSDKFYQSFGSLWKQCHFLTTNQHQSLDSVCSKTKQPNRPKKRV